jgi:glycerol-3-phosphate dehydrogenase
MEVTSLTKDDNGKLNRARVRDRIAALDGLAAEEIYIRARGVVNATGPFCDTIRKLDDQTVPNITA